MESKQRIRTDMIALRDRAAEAYRIQASQRIAELLLHSAWYGTSTKILVYAAIRSEVDLTPFILKAWADGKELYFPKVLGSEMEFFLARSEKSLVPGTFGVPEPADGEPLSRMLPFTTPMLVPGVAFTREGQRIGYGKGYYDKYLMANQKNKRLLTIGIAYAFQIVEEFETGEFDYPMQEIVTDGL